VALYLEVECCNFDIEKRIEKQTKMASLWYKTPEETIFSKELHDLQLQYVGRLFIHFVLVKAEMLYLVE
jgi:ring-1,2-phenylacetyl-CoA epoxidase subunit PaaE